MGLREEELEEALAELEERIRKLLIRALGYVASDIEVVVSLSHEGGKPSRLVVDVYASKRGASNIGDLVDAVIEEAVREFENRLGIKRGKAKRASVKGGGGSGHNP